MQVLPAINTTPDRQIIYWATKLGIYNPETGKTTYTQSYLDLWEWDAVVICYEDAATQSYDDIYFRITYD